MERNQQQIMPGAPDQQAHGIGKLIREFNEEYEKKYGQKLINNEGDVEFITNIIGEINNEYESKYGDVLINGDSGEISELFTSSLPNFTFREVSREDIPDPEPDSGFNSLSFSDQYGGSGDRFYVSEENGFIKQAEVSEPYTFKGAVGVQSRQFQDTIRDMDIVQGTEIILATSQQGLVHYKMSTENDLSTATFQDSFKPPHGEPYPDSFGGPFSVVVDDTFDTLITRVRDPDSGDNKLQAFGLVGGLSDPYLDSETQNVPLLGKYDILPEDDRLFTFGSYADGIKSFKQDSVSDLNGLEERQRFYLEGSGVDGATEIGPNNHRVLTAKVGEGVVGELLPQL